MISETGRVVSIEEDSLWVETIQKSACASCSAQKGCGQSLLMELEGRSAYVRVLLGSWRRDSVKLHDQVAFSIPDDVIGNGSLLVYLVPLMGLMAGVVVAALVQTSELVSVGLAVIGFLIAAALVRWHSFRYRDDPHYQPVLTDIIGSQSQCYDATEVKLTEAEHNSPTAEERSS